MEWLILAQWIVRLGMIPLVAYRRRLTSALSWLTLIFLFPILGSLGYLFFAEHRMTRRVRRHRDLVGELRSRERLSFQNGHVVERSLHKEDRTLAALTERLGGFAVLGGNEIDVMAGDDEAVGRIVEAIDAAEEHVHALYYIVADDRSGRRFAAALHRAAARGVRCRLLVDAFGSKDFLRHRAPELRDAGVDVHAVLRWPALLKRLRPLDLRNHRKLVVADGRVAFAGSMNMTDYDRSKGDEYTPWKDVVMRVRGPSVLQLQLVFEEDWRYNLEEPLEDPAPLYPEPRKTGDTAVQVVPGGPTVRVETIHHLLVTAIHAAERQVTITTPYFIPDDATRVALRLAAVRGVEVVIITPDVSDSRIVTGAARSYYDEYMGDGIRIVQHRSGFLHAKTITVDGDLAVIGSANFDRRSFFLNFELVLVLYGEEATAPVRRIQAGYLDDSRALDPDTWAERSAWVRLGEDMARLLSPLF